MSNETTSFWKGTSAAPCFPVLQGDLETDVAIIGGGITGISAAEILSRAGKRVVVLEAMAVGLGTTGHSTGNLHVMVDEMVHAIRDKWGAETASRVAAARAATIDAIEATVKRYGISCGFVRCPHFLYPASKDAGDLIEKEYRTLKEAGLPVSMTDSLQLPFPVVEGLRIDNQAQFHPLSHVRGLAEKINSDRCRIHENTKVLEIDDARMTLVTTSGRVHASDIIVATHTPKGFDPVQAELGPYREYGMAALSSNEQLPPGIYWSVENRPLSFRLCTYNGRRYLMVVGEEHKTGQHREEMGYLEQLEEFALTNFQVTSPEYRWSAQNYRPADLLPYIGKSLLGNRYIATGFGTNGLVYGPLAAAIIADQILRKDNPLADLFKPSRFTPLKSAKEFLTENLNVARQYARNYLSRRDLGEVKDILPGEGALVDLDGAVAVFRNEAGDFTLLSPVCTHLGCKVHWNRMEKSWDCPCHGSRFHAEGEVLEGPAIQPLELLNVVEDEEE